ncbi:MAG: Gfo/Idh/MocA family protein [Candidatus Binatia bacterium]
MRVAIIGANGNFGLKRLKAISRSPHRVVALCDLEFDQALKLLSGTEVRQETDYHRLLDADFDLAVVSLPDPIKLAVVGDFLQARRHVLVEKPLSLRVSEVRRLFALAREKEVSLYVGYNICFFPAVVGLLKLLQEGHFGSIHHLRLFYGHGGVHTLLNRQNWRVEDISWGGAFVDMGTHILALAARFVPSVETGVLERQYVVSKHVEDNCTALLKGKGCVVELASSWTAWRSRFSVEVYGSHGFAEIEGLAKYAKYGHAGERIRYGRANPSGPPGVKERTWTPEGSTDTGCEIVDPFSAEVEFLDQEWQSLSTAVSTGTFDMDKEEQINTFVADVCERFYR